MKLNIGCGKKFDPDYCNIDLYDSLVADKKMSALNLEFPEFSCQEVKAIHLIEHLGFYQSIYALSEFFRVLEQNGKLILETPNLEKVFQIYLNSNFKQRKDVLSWIYGLPHEGLQHKFGFPYRLMVEILEKIGFENIVHSNFYNEESIPTTKFICNKPENDEYLEIFQIFSYIRKRLLSEKLINFTNLFLTKEQEDLLNFLLIETLKIQKSKSKSLKYIEKALICSPEIVQIYLLEMINKEDLSNFELNHILDLTEYLIEFKFQNILYNALKNAPIIPGSQKIIFSSIESFGLAIINKYLNDKIEKNNNINNLRRLSKNHDSHEISFFSPNIIKRNSLEFFYMGIKDFYKENYKHSLSKFLTAIKLYRDDFLYYWNLAKTFVKLNLRQKAIRYYKRTLKFLNLTKVPNKIQIKKDIKLELNSIKKHQIKIPELKPVPSLDIYYSKKLF
ncbi:MAG: hypothetical protein JSV62_00530 [Promethearchaeota archaeon]|nr:MAG: hypothetical protein JSV62_00530 [Candidatus Lokiarchaeota archaeon]